MPAPKRRAPNTPTATTSPSQAARLYVHNAASTATVNATNESTATTVRRAVSRAAAASGAISTI